MADANSFQNLLQVLLLAQNDPNVALLTNQMATNANATDSPPPPNETPEKVQLGLQQLQSAIERLPLSMKSAYVEANERAPQLIEKEASGIRFIRASRWDETEAANRLTSYWETRKELFGEKWLEAMSQTGDGVLRRGDITALFSGFCTILPNSSSGHCCLFVDPSRVGKSKSKVRQRCMFYVLSLVGESILSQQKGIILIYTMGRNASPQSVLGDLSLHFLNVLPVRVHRLHIIGYPPSPQTAASIKQVEPILRREIKNYVADKKVLVHHEESLENLTKALTDWGFLLEHLPTPIGGTWDHVSNFAKFCEQRTRIEWGLPTARGGAMEDLASMGVPQTSTVSKKSLSEMDEEEKAERKRKMNTLHSRRKRERKRNETNSLQQQMSELQSENLFLYHDNKKLEALVERAKQIVESLHSKPSAQDSISLPSGTTRISIESNNGLPFATGSSNKNSAHGSSATLSTEGTNLSTSAHFQQEHTLSAVPSAASAPLPDTPAANHGAAPNSLLLDLVSNLLNQNPAPGAISSGVRNNASILGNSSTAAVAGRNYGVAPPGALYPATDSTPTTTGVAQPSLPYNPPPQYYQSQLSNPTTLPALAGSSVYQNLLSSLSQNVSLTDLIHALTSVLAGNQSSNAPLKPGFTLQPQVPVTATAPTSFTTNPVTSSTFPPVLAQAILSNPELLRFILDHPEVLSLLIRSNNNPPS